MVTRDGFIYTNRKHCPSHEMWSYKRDGRWCGWSFVRGSTVVYTGLFFELSFSKGGGVHDSYTFQCRLVRCIISPGIDTR